MFNRHHKKRIVSLEDKLKTVEFQNSALLDQNIELETAYNKLVVSSVHEKKWLTESINVLQDTIDVKITKIAEQDETIRMYQAKLILVTRQSEIFEEKANELENIAEGARMQVSTIHNSLAEYKREADELCRVNSELMKDNRELHKLVTLLEEKLEANTVIHYLPGKTTVTPTLAARLVSKDPKTGRFIKGV